MTSPVQEVKGKNGITYKVHRLAEHFPLLDGQEFATLVQDVKDRGLIEPVWLWQDPKDGTEYLLDGRNRVRACEAAGVEWAFRWYEGDNPALFVLSLNIARRHLEKSQRAVIVHDVLEDWQGVVKAKKSTSAKAQQGKGGKFEAKAEVDPIPAERQESDYEREATTQAAKIGNVSGRMVARVDRVAKEAPELLPDIRGGKLTVDAAEKTVKERKRREADAAAAIDHEKAERQRNARREVNNWKALTAHLLTYPDDALEGCRDAVVQTCNEVIAQLDRMFGKVAA